MPQTFSSFKNVKLAELINSGAVGVLPTDTLYGLVCKAENESAVKRLYSLKKRNNKPGTLIAASIDQLVEEGIKYRYLKAVEQYWPGPISVVLPLTDLAKSYLHQGKMSVAARIPKDKDLQGLLEKTGTLLTSSANLSGEQPAATVEQAQEIFGDKVDFYVEGGDLSSRKPSTLVRIIDDEVEVLREGAAKL